VRKSVRSLGILVALFPAASLWEWPRDSTVHLSAVGEPMPFEPSPSSAPNRPRLCRQERRTGPRQAVGRGRIHRARLHDSGQSACHDPVVFRQGRPRGTARECARSTGLRRLLAACGPWFAAGGISERTRGSKWPSCLGSRIGFPGTCSSRRNLRHGSTLTPAG
jgi:hypothetical protein